jgi:hypothetical protein
VEIQSGAEVTARSLQDDDLGLTRLLDEIELLHDRPGKARRQGVPPGGAVEREPMDGPAGFGQQLGHRSALQGGGATSGEGQPGILSASPPVGSDSFK